MLKACFWFSNGCDYGSETCDGDSGQMVHPKFIYNATLGISASAQRGTARRHPKQVIKAGPRSRVRCRVHAFSRSCSAAKESKKADGRMSLSVPTRVSAARTHMSHGCAASTELRQRASTSACPRGIRLSGAQYRVCYIKGPPQVKNFGI